MSCHDDTTGWSRAACGIDPRAGGALVVRGERARGAVRLAGATALDDPRVVADFANGVPCVAAMPARAGFVRVLRAPFAARSKARKVYPTLLDLELPFPLETCIHEFVELPAPAGERSTRRSALAVGARREDMERCLAECRARGADPVRLEHEGLVLWSQSLREFPPAANGEPAWRAVVRADAEDGVLVLGEHGRPRSAHGLRFAHLEADINRLMLATVPAGTPVSWIWCGSSGAGEARARLAVTWPGPTRLPPEPEAFLARGLATAFLSPGPWNVNLRTAEFLHPAVRQRGRRRRLAAGIAVLAAGLALLGAAWKADRMARAAEARVDARITAAASEVAGFPVVAKGAYALAAARQAADERRAALTPFLDAVRPIVSERMAILMREAAARDVRFGHIAADGSSVAATGDAGAWDTPDRLAARLQAAGVSARVEKREARTDDGRISFTLSEGPR